MSQPTSDVPADLPAHTGRARGRLEVLGARRPAPRATGALPAQPTSLVGRTRDLALAGGLLLRGDVRLLTLTGPAGVGKTRLAVALAERMVGRFADGAGFVDLARIDEPGQVVSAITRALGAPPAGGRQALRALQDFLELREILLVLDNFEHLLEAAPRLAEILTECPAVKLVVTSRAPLRLRWEHVLTVRPLALPAPGAPPMLRTLARTPAVSLLVERVRQADRAFALTPENAAAVAELCVRLDGLPLAIELAARRVSASSLAAILQRLTQLREVRTPGDTRAEGRSEALGRGARDLPPRQQSLDAAMAWSYELLTPDEQAAFRRLSVFEGGFSLGAGCWVIGDGGAGDLSCSPITYNPPPLTQGVLDRLVDSSLVVADRRPGGGQRRYRLLETIRRYGADRLEEAGEEDAARDAHRDWYLRYAEAVDPELWRGGERTWLPELDADFENFRAALAWSEQRGDLQAVARLSAALWWYLHLRGLMGEAHEQLSRALAMEGVPPAVRAKLLNGAAMVAYDRGEYLGATALAQEALALSEQAGDACGAAFAQSSLGFIAYFQGEYDRAEALLRRGLALARESGDHVNVARTLNNLGVLALARGEPDAVRALFEESLTHWRQVGSDGPTALALLFLGRAAHERGEQSRAAALLDESVAVARRAGYARAAGPALYLSGRVAMSLRQPGRATALFQESLTIRREQGDRRGIAECFDGLATAAAARRQPEVAARLVGAAEGLRAAIGVALTPFAAAAHTQLVDGLERRLGEGFAGIRAEGQATPLDEAVRFALGGRPEPEDRRAGLGGRRPPGPTAEPESEPSPTLLSQREREVAALLVRGLSNREIAAALVLTEGSASNYVKRILAKLGFRSRAQVGVWAARHGFGAPPDD